jgi:beta-glucanase (GH16 family)
MVERRYAHSRDTQHMICVRVFLLLAALSASAWAQGDWKLVWSDEFNGPAGSAPDPAKWAYDLGATGWGNRELENYTNSRDNSYLDGQGNLVIKAIKNGSSFTSARLKTAGLFAFTYGKIEGRMKLPYGQGIWPAFWMLGDTSKARGWPAVGEIDVMENIGKEPATVRGTVHGPGYSGGKGIGKGYSLPSGARFADDFHVYAAVWNTDSIEFFVDGTSHFKLLSTGIPEGATWAFDHPFYIILNLAVGGDWPGKPDDTTQFPQQLTVDYVRVYQK